MTRMTKDKFDKLYLDKVVHCDTEEKANEFLALAESVGYKWSAGIDLVGHNYWEDYGKETCYHITKDGVLFADTNYYNSYGYQIIEYQPQPKFKVGDKVRINNTSKVGVIERVGSLRQIPYAVKIDDYIWHLFLTESELEKVEDQICKEETTESIIDEIKAKWSEISILLNRLEKKEKVE
jgi:hypothetical protein